MANRLNCGTVYCKRNSMMQGSYLSKLSVLPAFTFKELKESEISNYLLDVVRTVYHLVYVIQLDT